MASKGGLGTGLSALFEDNKTNTDSGQTLRITEIEPNREQPRKNFDDESISALAESIKPVSYTHLDVYKRQVIPVHTDKSLMIIMKK